MAKNSKELTKEELEEKKAIEAEKKKNKQRANRQEKVKVKGIIEEMKELGIYKSEFDETISTLAKKMVMMDRLWESLSEDDFIFSTDTAAGGAKGNPEATLFLNLSKSVETHQEKLGLTPSGYLSLTGTTTSEVGGSSHQVSSMVDAITSTIRRQQTEEDLPK